MQFDKHYAERVRAMSDAEYVETLRTVAAIGVTAFSIFIAADLERFRRVVETVIAVAERAGGSEAGEHGSE